jgi:hypothetical protein
MARLGDGWITNIRSLEQLRPKVDRLTQFLEQVGRDKAAFGIETRLNTNLVGPEGWIKFIDECKTLGATHLVVNTMGCGYETPSAHLEALRQFSRMAGLS